MDSGRLTPLALQRRADLGQHLQAPRVFTPSIREVVSRPANKHSKLPVFRWTSLPTSIPQVRRRTPSEPVPPFLEDYIDETWQPSKLTVKRQALYQTVNIPRPEPKRTYQKQQLKVTARPQPAAKGYKPLSLPAKTRVLAPLPAADRRSSERKQVPRLSAVLPMPSEEQELKPFPSFEDIAWTFGERLNRARMIVEHAKSQIQCA